MILPTSKVKKLRRFEKWFIFAHQIKSIMDAFWYGLEDVFEWVFELCKPFGRKINIFFVLTGFVGAIFWLIYGEYVRKGGHNFVADKVTKNKGE